MMKAVRFGWRGAMAWMPVLALLWAGCDKTDRELPAIALSAPNDGFVIMADSEFVIAGIASDDRGLGSITAILYNATTDQVVQSKSVSVDGLQSPFSFQMAAGDRYTASGTYVLQVTAVDGGENAASAFAQITIQELPLAYRGAAWAGDLGAGNFSISKLDTAGNVMAGPGNVQLLADLLADNRNGTLVGVTSAPGSLIGWDLDGLGQVFRYDEPQGTGASTFSCLSMNQGRYVAGLAVPDYVRTFRFDGAPVAGFADALHPATAVLGTADRYYVALEGVLGTPQKLDAYSLSGTLEATLVMDWRAEGILALNEDELLVWGNDGGSGSLELVGRNNMVDLARYTMAEPLRAVAVANGRAWVLSDQGVYEYFPVSNSLSGLLVAGSYTSLQVDATLNRLFLGGVDRVELRSGAGALLQEFTGAFGAVKFIETVYNK